MKTPRKATTRNDTDRLLFVDTNIWLDFYRARTDAGLALLNHLDAVRTRLISTYQVEMEFKKNRQQAILDGFSALKAPENIPQIGLFSDAKTQKALRKDIKNADTRVKSLKQRLRNALDNPARYDPVYKVCQRCFHGETPWLLMRGKTPVTSTIRRKAFRRFIYGYPPRKKNDTSIGDAINWEWIIECAINSKAEIHIVTRDSDYGITFENTSYLNDHLLQEFKDRVSKKRKIILHSKLSAALRSFEIQISPSEEQEEDRIIRVTKLVKPSVASSDDIDSFEV